MRKVCVLLCALVLTLYGEVGGGADRVPTSVIVHGGGAGKATTRQPRASAFRTGATAFEPTLGVTAEGTILFQGAHYPTQLPLLFSSEIVPDVVRSRNGGATWEYVSPTIGDQSSHRSTHDPFLYVDPDTDRAFTVDWLQNSYCSQLSHSDDGGRTWSMTRLGCGGADHQHLFTGPPASSTTLAYPNVVYLCAQSIPSAICSKSLDGGLTFRNTGAPPFLAVSDVLDCGRLTGHGEVGPDGTVYLPSACNEPYLALSRDEGATWDVVTVAQASTNDNHEAAVGVDAKGRVYYLWMKANRLPYLAISTDGGQTFPRVLRLSPPGLKEASLPALAVDDSGIVAAALYGFDGPFG